MAEQEKDKQLDELLDSMLSRYAAEEPRPGLETRVLARIAEAHRPVKANVWRWLWLGAGAAGIAAAVIAFLISSYSRPQQVAPTMSQAQQQPSAAQARLKNPESNRAPVPVGGIRKRSIHRARVVDVRQEVFPSPEPLSEQEKLMLRYLSATPRQELLAQSHPDPLPDEKALGNDSQLQ